MKANSIVKPDTLLELGNGKWHYNFNIHEEMFEFEGVNHKQFSFEAVEIIGEPTVNKCIEAVIREKYSENEELSMINKYNSYINGVSIDSSIVDEYSSYLKFVGKVKNMVKNDFHIIEETNLDITKRKKIDDIHAYDKSNNVNYFYVNEQGTWLSKNDRIALKSMINDSVAEGATDIDLWFNLSGEVVKINLPCDTALTMLRQLELYAKSCYDVTASHIKAVEDCTTIAEVEAVDITAGYPEKLNFTI